MIRMSGIRWDKFVSALSTILLVFLAVAAAPSYSRGHAPVILTAVIIILLLLQGTGEKAQPVRMIDISILVLILVLGFTTMPAIEPHRSWIWAAAISGGLLVMLATREMVRRWFSGNQVLAGLLSTGFIFQVILTGEIIRWYITWRTNFPEFVIPPQSYRFANGNAWAAYLIPLIFLQLGLFFSYKKILTRWLTALSIVWSLALLFFCSSRGGMIGLGAAGATFIIIERKTVWEWLRPAWNLFTRRRWITATAGLMVTLGAAAGIWMVFQAFQSHPTHGSFGLGSRATYWIPAWNAFLQSPIWGNGFFSEASFFMATTSIPPAGLYIHSHNLYLDILQGSGLIGAAAAGFFIFTLIKGLWQARQNAPANALPLSMAALPILAGFLTHSLFDSLYWMPIVSIPLAIIFGAALVYDNQEISIKLPAVQIAAILTLAGVWGLYYVQQPYLEAMNLAENDNPAATAASLDKAVERIPVSPIFNQEAGLAHAELAVKGNTGELEKAIKAFEAATRHDSNYAVNWLNLGALQREAGNLTEARETLETAVIKADRWGLAWLNLGETCEMQGDEACARNAYMKALELEPSWTTDPYWQDSNLRQAVVMAAEAAAFSDTASEPLTVDEVIRQGYLPPVMNLAGMKINRGELDDAERLLKITPYFFPRFASENIDAIWLKAELAAAKGNRRLAVELGVEAREQFEKSKLNDRNVAGIYVYGQDIYQLETPEVYLVPQVSWMQYPGDWENRMEKLADWQK